ncbi:MAG: hypothetical protein DRR15_06330, partial [Gammaproteobacteria bacterium]
MFGPRISISKGLYTLHNNHSLYIRISTCFALLILSACATRLEPLSLPPETSPEPSQSVLWRELQSVRDDDWNFLLNDGATALDWRLRAIDSA